jgi:hypothetical protein
MKKFLLFTLFSIIFSFQLIAQDYYPMVREGATWKMYTYDFSFPTDSVDGSIQYTLSGDTLINDTTYKKLIASTYTDAVPYPLAEVAYLRENIDERKVYIRFRDQDTALYNGNRELMLYDFSLSEGDSFFLYEDFDGNEVNILNDTVYTIEGEERNAWLTDFPTYAGNLVHRIYVEGIGFLSDPLMPVNYDEYAFLESYLFCYENSADNISHDFVYSFLPEGLNCSTLLSIQNEDISAKIQLYPNPADQMVVVALPQLGEIRIVDITGKQVFQQKAIQEDQTRIDLGFLPGGIYLIRVCDEGRNCGTRKLAIR